VPHGLEQQLQRELNLAHLRGQPGDFSPSRLAELLADNLATHFFLCNLVDRAVKNRKIVERAIGSDFEIGGPGFEDSRSPSPG
jgi:hypothetical protein